MRRATTTTTDSLTLSPGRSPFELTEEEEGIAISFAVGLRGIVRRARADDYSAADVAEAFARALSDWPADRAAAVLQAVDALAHLPTPRPAVFPAARVNGDGIDCSGAA
jgi:hypothetical protein